MNFQQLVKSIQYRTDNGINWNEIMFFAADTVFGSAHSWSLSELGMLMKDSGGTLGEFLQRNSLVELGFIFVR